MLIVDTSLSLEYREEIGLEGRNSTVNKAFDPQLNAELVVKRINKSEFTKTEDYFKEAQMLYASEHPNIMGIKYATQDTDYIYLTMDYYKNGSINSLLEKRFLTVKEIIKYSLEFLSGIHFMHTKNLVHFDIKPTNILISNSNKAVVTDFGLAKYLNESGFAQPDKFYPLHVPPETFETGKFSFYTDIYQAGLTIYRMCNGNTNFKQQLRDLNIQNQEQLAEAIRKNKFPQKSNFLPHIPDKFQQIIKKSLMNDVTKRYETILDMINEISSIEDVYNWEYTEGENDHFKFTEENENHKLELSLIQVDDKWETIGVRIRSSDNKTTRVTKWCTSGYNNKEEAFMEIKKMLKYK
ncbi:serine/threonine-protein kinase [Sporosarcina obsidiansis]|uniref:serine/threonine-protein kinase n=1 Tax=Sporosarcina obsidiansis TaxID=2660748 RepID=UPI00129B1366|nr:serine/threonine-protein kinase [Sporosarcina obsidiansis]